MQLFFIVFLTMKFSSGIKRAKKKREFRVEFSPKTATIKITQPSLLESQPEV